MTFSNKQHKTFSKKPSQNNKQHDSKTNVYFSRGRGVGLWGNARVPMTVRVDKELKKQFLLFSKRVFGSICLPIEIGMATLIGLTVELKKQGVYTSNTVPLKLDVGKIVIERNLRSRRKLEVDDVEEVSKKRERVFYRRRVEDLSKLSLEELEQRYARAKRRDDVVTVHGLQEEANKRGFKLLYSYEKGEVKKRKILKRDS